MKKYLIALIFVVLAPSVFAAEATSQLSWSAPETREDGTALLPGEIAQYTVFYSVDSPVDAGSTSVVVGGSATDEAIVLELTPRAEPYTVSFAIVTVDTEGRESALSEVVSKDFAISSTATPRPPTRLRFAVICGDGCVVLELDSVAR